MNSIESRRGKKLAALIVVALLSLFVAGCAQLPEAAPPDAPAVLAEVPGTGLHQITLTEHAVERLGLKTEATATDPQTQKLTVAYGAVLYDSAGKTWVYTNPEHLVFVRQSITVERINGDVATLKEGPSAGTTVVTTGAAELFGAEFDTAE
ncbi:hypothetical protein QFZ40_001740 [Arthrobacter pascens]|uniref:hypothetical protein n=1 Tax=Arthrobacter pascens TaxID=1677 RepID=UPI002788E3DE|nr:hypothetical protein [Arthrobacter pascens]MDQ0633831.1 hypothetical protein [Arthrobacter pascens]